jgi:hypothetical protein
MSDDINVSWIIYILTTVLVKISLYYIQCICLRPSCAFPRPSSTAHWVFLEAWTSLWTSPPSYITLHVPQTTIFSHPSFLKHFLSPYFPIYVVLNTSWSHHLQFDCRKGRVLISYHLTILASFCYTLKLEPAWSSDMFVKFYHITRCNILGGAFSHSRENFVSYALGDI